MATIEDVRGITPQMNFEWEVDILGPSTGGESALTIHAQTVTIPETSLDIIEMNFKSEKTTHAGRTSSPRTMTIGFIEDQNLTVYKFFKNWLNLIHNEFSGGGVNRAGYIAGINVSHLEKDSTTVSALHTILGAYPTSLGDVSLSYDNSEIMTVEVTFSFQNHSVA